MDAPVLVRVPFEHAELQAPERAEVAVAGEAIWIVRHHRRTHELLRFDVASAQIASTVELDYGVRLLAADDGSLWAVGPWGYAPGPEAYTLSTISLETGEIESVLEAPIGGIAVGFGSIWVGGGARLRRIDAQTLETTKRWQYGADVVQVACGNVWRWSWYRAYDDDRLIFLDPATADEGMFEGTGPLFELGGQCWRSVEGGLERLRPWPTVTTPAPAAYPLDYDGAAFWRRPDGLMQAWDPALGMGTGPTYVLDKQDISSYWKLGDDGIVVAAGGRLWLVNGWEIVGFDIPAG